MKKTRKIITMKSRSIGRRLGSLSFFLCMMSIPGFAVQADPSSVIQQIQDGKVTGYVVDSNGETVIGATIVEKGTTNGTVTDFDGKFTLSVSENALLEISFVGYKPQTIKAVPGKNLRVTLLEDKEILDEVVVIGYGTQKKADLTGAVSNVNTEKINTQSNTTIGQALQGRIAGVDIVSGGGAPGAGMKIMIRGIGTLNNSSPLYIVDGMYMSGIDHINPNDIASIDVLKDASSAAIYGSRAANGVVIVTTKSGSDTEGKPVVDLSANIGVTMPSKYLETLNAEEWAKVTTVSRENVNLKPLDMALELSNKEDNDWQDIIMGPALMHNYNLSVKGGGKYSKYYNSVGYTRQDGVVKNSDFQRYTLQSKVDFKKGIFNAGTNIILTYDERNPPIFAQRGGIVGNTLLAIPTLSKYDESRIGGYGGLYGDVINLRNPLGLVDRDIHKTENNNLRISANAYLSVELLKGLKYKLNVTPDFTFSRNYNYIGLFDFGLQTQSKTDAQDNQSRYRNVVIENLLTYDRTFGDHKISALAGYSYQDTRRRGLVGLGQELPAGIYEISSATSGISASGHSNRSVLTSILGRAFYSYKNRYLVTATIRRDGSSKFAKNNRYGIFPSFSLGWNIAEENFIKENAPWLNQLKLRGGYGVLGNQEIADYQYAAVLSSGINYGDGKGGLLYGSFPKLFANPDIKWEETASTNIGIDLLSLDNRLSLTCDWYVKNTKDILLGVPIPNSVGAANSPTRNAGKIKNYGVEFNLGWNDYVSPDFSYGANFIGSFNKNEVIRLGSESQEIPAGQFHGGAYLCKTLTGYPIGGFWLIPCDGYFNSEADVQAHNKDGQLIQPSAKPGDIRFKDVNDDGMISDEDRAYCGSPFPKFTFSLNGNVTYKQFDFSMGWQGVVGNKIYNATRAEMENVTKGTNFLKSTLDYWTPENTDASVPRLAWNDTNRNCRSESDRFLENGSYLRLRSLQLGYTLPSSLFKGAIKKARVYVNAENLFTITSYSGYSPDVNASSAYSRGVDYFIYPSLRTFMLGVNVSF